MSSGKPVYTYANEFHELAHKRLRGVAVLQDLDGYAGQPMIASAGHAYDYAPLALLELKRSRFAPADWRPYDVDRPNYAALLAVARLCRIPLYVVYWRKGELLAGESTLAVFRLDEAVPVYFYGAYELMSCDTFVARFPYPLPTGRGTV